MMPPSLSHYYVEGEDRRRDEKKKRIFCGDGLFGYRDVEVRVIHVGGDSMASAVCMDKLECWIAQISRNSN